MSTGTVLYKIFDSLLACYGPQHWWPADSPFEVMLGAVLTQNTAWTSVEKAIGGLREVAELTPEKVLLLSTDKLQTAIRPSGYYRQKAARLQDLCRFLVESYRGDLSLMDRLPTDELREQILSLPGIGPETADSILLYALERPVFVVDAYTIRLCSRLGLTDARSKYAHVQSLFADNLSPDTGTYNQFHALIVKHAKTACRKKSPRCHDCVLLEVCRYGNMNVQT